MSVADLIPGFAPKREVTRSGDDYIVTVTPPDFMHMPARSVRLTSAQHTNYLRWRNGHGMIQDCLQDLSDDDREILQTGIGPDDFENL